MISFSVETKLASGSGSDIGSGGGSGGINDSGDNLRLRWRLW